MKIYLPSGGGKGRAGWGGGGSGLPVAVTVALSSPLALPILQAMAIGVLAVKDHTTPVAGSVPGYDLIYNDLADGATKISYPDAGIDIFDLSAGI
jgi:hypothetical protein